MVYTADLDGSQEVPPNDSPTTGVGTFEINTDTNTIRDEITFQESDLLGAETVAHIQCCAGERETARPIIDPPLGNPTIGFGTFEEDQEEGILAGLSYVNIHTETYPNGEIRGQILATGLSADEAT